MNRTLCAVAVAATSVLAVPAYATTWDSNSATAATAPAACNTTGIGFEACQMTMTVSGQTVKVRAYSTRTADQTSGGLWRSASLYQYTGGGFGITNNVSSDTNEGVPPEHAVDNNQVYDVLVFELPDKGFDLEAFELGWAQEGSISGEADVQAWVGGNNLGADYNFSNACFSSNGSNPCTAGQVLTTGLGFTDVTSLFRNSSTNQLIPFSNSNNNVPVNTLITLDGTNSGRYLVMAGALGGTNDNFKVDVLKASPIPGGGSGGSSPEPATLALMGLGLAGLGAMRRRISRPQS